MQQQSATRYHANHATFEMPTQLKDKSMHMFTLNDSGPSDFSVVVSHAEVLDGETLIAFSKRMTQEMSNALPRFTLSLSKERRLDDAPAWELAYSWPSGDHYMYQRQVMTLVEGAHGGTVQAMLIAATCLAPFSASWNATFDGILESTRLRRKLAQPADLATSAEALSTIFVLSERRRTLHAFVDMNEACRKIDPREVQQDAWAFFSASGSPLHARLLDPTDDKPGRKSYVLDVRADSSAPRLHDCLHMAALLVTSSPALPFTSIADVRAHLVQER
ncbi:DcrB-related protein [Massilia genomosp. 1]|uniref:DUF1795 domain-containing protein n=1 Tax=Massilia genomosp. 1 TaxID=2609280 RepID=A0ABX0N4B0_9BURK|nr:DcrB-related protein [Massilia genomosp. 1]NHZ66860.1 DUF1795 domain-containing protein [Massilia genomosp. 1]